MAGDMAQQGVSGMQKATGVAAGGLSIASLAGYLSNGPYHNLFLIILVGIVASALIVVLYKLFLSLKDKSKSGPFAKLLSRGAASTVDPATKARMDDLRKTFDKGVETFSKAGKDLYTLPWFLLVGPSGSGKTEALRHSNIGFPQGLQDCFQGAGGTLNMHWWFTNQAVVLDTAGRMFMQDSEAGLSEWKEFLKLLKLSRPNCPINGMLLVISSENLLKDSAEKIDATAGVIARQLDLIQRTLDVRFPVTVLVTKCDKIVGFREFFETLTDPIMKHQMLGWSNPTGLDDAFKPEMVEKHLADVRTKLMKRRMGLLQNPVHSQDPSARRTDQVDELFELPDNLMRIAPRLRSYLEKIFVAGEWSPKPLFLRGIYFTSSMREGQALDMSLAQALGVEVESLPGGRDWDKDSAYFLRDTFLSKVFREKGLVTRATNVNKALAKQKAIVLGVVGTSLLFFAGIVGWGAYSFNATLEKPKSFWTAAADLINGNLKGEDQSVVPLRMFDPSAVKGAGATYVGDRAFTATGGPLEGGTLPGGLGKYLGDEVDTPAEVIAQTTANTGEIDVPLIAKPIISSMGGARALQVAAHREVVQRNVAASLLEQTRIRLSTEDKWNSEAVRALGELVRLQTYSLGLKPADGVLKATAGKTPPARLIIDVDALFKYVLSTDEYKRYAAKDAPIFASALSSAYPEGFGKDTPVSKVLFDPANHTEEVLTAVASMKAFYSNIEFDRATELGVVQQIVSDLVALESAEEVLWKQRFLQADSADTKNWMPETVKEYDEEFASKFKVTLTAIRAADEKLAVTLADKALKDKYNGNPATMLREAGERRKTDLQDQIKHLLEQLPPEPAAPAEGKDAVPEKPVIAALRLALLDGRSKLGEKLAAKLNELDVQLKNVLPSLAASSVGSPDGWAFRSRLKMYGFAEESIDAAAAPVAAASDVRKFDEVLNQVTTAFNGRKGSVQEVRSGWSAAKVSIESLSLDEAKAKERNDQRAKNGEGAAKKAIEIAASRARYGAAMARINTFPKEGAAEYVAGVAKLAIDKAAINPFKIQEVRFTTVSGARLELDPRYHPETVVTLLGDVYTIEGIVNPVSPGQANAPMLDQKSIRAEIDRVKVSLDSYVDAYGSYWTDLVTDATKPEIENWDAFKDAMKGFDIRTVIEPLGKVYEMADAARAGLPPRAQELPAIKDCKIAIERSFGDSGFATREGRAKVSEVWGPTVDLWSRLSFKETADAACDQLRGDLKRQTNRVKYFRPLVETSPLYFREFVKEATRALADASKGGVAQDWTTVFREGKNLPLAKGMPLPGLGAVRVDELGKIARRLEAAPEQGGKAEDSEIPPIHPDVDDAINLMAGGDVLDKPGRRELLSEVRKLAGALSSGKLVVEFKCPEYQEGNLGNQFPNGWLVKDGQRKAIGKVNQETLVTDSRQRDERRIALPASGCRIELADTDRDEAAPQRTIQLADAWPMLAEALAEGTPDKDGWVLVKFKSADGWLALMVRWNTDGGVPALKDWPLEARKWPT